MKNILTINKNSFIFYMSMLAIIGLLWSCQEDENDNPVVPGPTISAITPGSAWVGDAVTITGTNFFATVAGNNLVNFNGAAATVTAVSGTTLTVIVPDDASSGEVMVRANNQNSEGFAFTVRNPVPIITAIDPGTGPEGASVTITGKNFSSTPADNTVSFNGTTATVTASTAKSITTTVPDGATPGNVTVTAGGETSEGVAFTVLFPPTVLSMEPTIGKAGDVVTITGKYFSTTPEENVVTFSGIAATVSASTATSITVIVPEGAPTGEVIVTEGGETSTGLVFTVTAGTLRFMVVDPADDIEEYRTAEGDYPAGYMDLGSSDLELCTESTDAKHVIGLIFRGVKIPAGATITNAYIQFTCDDNDNDEGPLSIDIWGIKEDNTSAPFLADLFNCSSRPSTITTVNWQAPVWEVKNEKGPLEATPDLKEIVQEIIDLPGWTMGNNIGFKLANEETEKIHREAEAFEDNNNGEATELVVSYTTN